MGIRANALRAGLGTFLGTLGGDLAQARKERRAGDQAASLSAMQGRQRMGEMTLRQVLEQMDPEKRAQAMATLQGTEADTELTRTRTAGLTAQNQREATGARTPQQDLEASRQQLGQDELSVRRGELEQKQARQSAPAPSVRAERLARLEEWETFLRQNPRSYLAIADLAAGLEGEEEVEKWFKRPDVSLFLKRYVESLAEQGQWEIGQTAPAGAGGVPMPSQVSAYVDSSMSIPAPAGAGGVPMPSRVSAYVDSSMPIPAPGGVAAPVFSGGGASGYRIGDVQEGPAAPTGPAPPATPGGGPQLGPQLGPFAEKAVARAIAAGLSREQAIQQMIQIHGEAALAQ